MAKQTFNQWFMGNALADPIIEQDKVDSDLAEETAYFERVGRQTLEGEEFVDYLTGEWPPKWL